MVEHLTERLRGSLDAEAARALAEHLATCEGCRAEAEELERLWSEMGRLDEDVPSERMRARLWSALAAYEAHGERGPLSGLRRALERVWPQRPAWQLALTGATLVLGLLLGGRLVPDSRPEIAALRGELQAMERSISLALLEHRSASERLRGVEWSSRAEPDERVVAALLETVRHDPNVNVRLAAVEALAPLVARPAVGGELLAALAGQDSPLVQVSLAELLLRGGVAGSERTVRELLERDDLDGTAREYLQAVMRDNG